MNMPPVSFSALTTFENCPRQYQETKVLKHYVSEDTEATLWGKEVHSALELRIKEGRALPSWGTKWEKIAEAILSKKHRGATVETEMQLAINKNFQKTDWADHDAWARCILDLVVIDGDTCTSIDWKTGKKKPSKQLEMSAGIIFCHCPEVEVVKTAFFWLKSNDTTKEEYKRKDIPIIWNEFMPRVNRLEAAYEADKWPCRPSGLCSQWCPVLSCTYNGKNR